jgi:hypothetical protein
MPIGRPLSPVSVAGVARRNDRRGPGGGAPVKTVAVAAAVGPAAAVAVHHRNKR